VDTTRAHWEPMEARLEACESRIADLMAEWDGMTPEARERHAEHLEALLATREVLLGKLDELERACAETCEGFSAAARHARLVLMEVYDRVGGRFH